MKIFLVDNLPHLIAGSTSGGVAAYIVWSQVWTVAIGAGIGVVVTILIKSILWDMYLKDKIVCLFKKK